MDDAAQRIATETQMKQTSLDSTSAWRLRLAQTMDGRAVQRLVTGLILINAAILGLLTSPPIVSQWGWLLVPLDAIILACFVAERACVSPPVASPCYATPGPCSTALSSP